jgi:hypothetical protein
MTKNGKAADGVRGNSECDHAAELINSENTKSCVTTQAPICAELLEKINAAAQAVNESETAVAAAQADRVQKCKALGLLLLDAKKLYPKVKDFEAFLAQSKHVKLSAAYDYMRLVGGRKTDEEVEKAEQERRKEARLRKQKSRAKLLPKPAPKRPEPEPEPKVSVTEANVTETAEASAEKRKAESADLDLSAEERAAKRSAHYLAEFAVACRTYLPKITVEADRQKARLLVSELTSGKPKAKAA